MKARGCDSSPRSPVLHLVLGGGFPGQVEEVLSDGVLQDGVQRDDDNRVGGREGLSQKVLYLCQSRVSRWAVKPCHNPATSVAAKGERDVGVADDDGN